MTFPCWRRHAMRCVFHAALLILLAFAWPAPNASAGDGDALQLLVGQARTATIDSDFAGLAKLVAPSERALAAQAVDLLAGMVAGFSDESEKLMAEYREVLKKYELEHLAESSEDDHEGLSPDSTPEEFRAHQRKLAEKTFAEVDTVAFAGDMMAFVIAAVGGPGEPIFPEGAITDVAIEGDNATATLEGEEIAFLREDGTWYLTSAIFD